MAASSEQLNFAERGSGPPLLVHGLMVSGEILEPVIGRFAAAWADAPLTASRGASESVATLLGPYAQK